VPLATTQDLCACEVPELAAIGFDEGRPIHSVKHSVPTPFPPTVRIFDRRSVLPMKPATVEPLSQSGRTLNGRTVEAMREPVLVPLAPPARVLDGGAIGTMQAPEAKPRAISGRRLDGRPDLPVAKTLPEPLLPTVGTHERRSLLPMQYSVLVPFPGTIRADDRRIVIDGTAHG
jgi:hypothetical protein